MGNHAVELKCNDSAHKSSIFISTTSRKLSVKRKEMW